VLALAPAAPLTGQTAPEPASEPSPEAPAPPEEATPAEDDAGAAAGPRRGEGRARAGREGAGEDAGRARPPRRRQRRGAPPPSEAARTFSAKFKVALALEAKVQDWEARSVATDDLEKLPERRRERAERVLADAERRSQARAYAIAAQTLPGVGKDVTLEPEDVDLLIDIKRAHETTRSTRLLDHWMELNQSFLESYNWAERDMAVALRDEVVARETALTELISQARRILEGESTRRLREEARETLLAVAPRVAQKTEDRLEVRMLEDPKVRGDAFLEMRDFLTEHEESRPASETLPRFEDNSVQELQRELIDATGIGELLESTVALEQELTELDARIEVAPTEEDLARRTEVVRQLEANRQERYMSPPEPEVATRLMAAHAGAIRGRLEDLGTLGALHASRADALEDEVLDRVDAGFPAAPTWETLDAQMELLNELEQLGAEEDPLAAIDRSARDTNIETVRKLMNSQALKALQKKLKAQGKAGPRRAAPRPPRSFVPKKKPAPRKAKSVFKPRGKPRGRRGGGRGGRGGRGRRP